MKFHKTRVDMSIYYSSDWDAVAMNASGPNFLLFILPVFFIKKIINNKNMQARIFKWIIMFLKH